MDATQQQQRAVRPAAAGRSGLCGFLRRLRRDRRGTTALEFAIVGPLFLLLIMAILENALILWSQAVLDNATRDAARLTLTGQSQSGGTSFQTALCKGVGPLMNCAYLKYRMETGSSFSSMASASYVSYPSAPVSPTPGSYVLLQVIYTRPFIIPWVGKLMSSNGKTQILATQAFETEPY
ncbi:MAG: TadE/TadG family type IV pilus assembly protein [Stellaceae bacterium]